LKNNIAIPQTQRALVLQGGGALGAYEVGVLKVLCNKLIEGAENSQKDESLFDIVAGTSIGAINAAVLVSNVVNRKKTWKEAVKELENFWTDTEKGLSSTPDYSEWWWNDGKYQDKNAPNTVKASAEAARKYYSVKEYLKHGTPKVCTAPLLSGGLDDKFGDQVDNLWFHHTSEPLENTIVQYSKDPNNNKKLKIASSWDKGQPRLLVVSVDVAEGKTSVFDSYHKNAEDSENSAYEDGDGITINHVMASATIPIFYDFREIGGRKFCDGGILSNTPFRELLQAHRDYWTKVVGEDRDEIPDLEVYVINLHPSKMSINNIPQDYDGVKDRINDIIYSDRNSHYDEMVADLVTDYTELIDKLKELAKSHFKNKDERDTFQNDFENLLKTTKAKSRAGTAEHRKYKDLLKGRFKLTKVVRIEPKSYDDSISGKGADFTSKTIRSLIEQGKKDALKVLK
jgi:predicted acylesterase/phospholipase RssA